MPKLQKGDRVGVVATAFAARGDAVRDGIAGLARMGFEPVPGSGVDAAAGYFAGDDDTRVADLNRMLRDRSVRGIWFVRGGYGTARLLDRVDWRAWRRDPRVFVGYSDLTALFAAADRRGLGRCVHGPVVTELGDPDAVHRPSLRAALAGKPYELRFRRSQVLVAGSAEGRLVGGNLTVLGHLCGTRHLPDLRDRVLFLEEIGEPTYRIDRILTQLAQAAALSRVSAVLLGEMEPTPRRKFPPDRALEDVLAERFGKLGVPVIRGLPAGHRPRARSLSLGARVRVDTDLRKVELRP